MAGVGRIRQFIGQSSFWTLFSNIRISGSCPWKRTLMEMASRSFLLFKFVLLVVAFPLVLAGVGFWQYARTAEADELLVAVNKRIAAIQYVQQKTGDPHVLLEQPDGIKYRASMLLRHNGTIREQAKRNSWWQRMVCTPLSWGVMLCGAFGAGVGSYGLFTVRQAGERALHSREALLHEFRKGLRKLPWLIGSIGLCISLAVALSGLFEIVDAVVGDFKGKTIIRPLVAGSLCVGVGLFFSYKMVRNIYAASKSVFERAPLYIMGKSVTREEAPMLWAFVSSVADRVGAAEPDAIILGLDESFFVTEHTVELLNGMPVPKGRVLYLPLPFMVYMTRPEAEAVLGHELSHFSGADTEYNKHFASIYSAAAHNLHAVDSATDGAGGRGFMSLVAKPAMMFGIYYLDAFDLAVQYWNREREFAADRMGAAIAGNEAVALSLLRVGALTPCVYRALGDCWNAGDNQSGGVLHRMVELVQAHGLEDPADYLEEQQSHPMDSHPVTCQRLEALGALVTKELLERAQSREESGLLRELGLDGEIRLALETEFFQAAQEDDKDVPEDLHEVATLGMERVVMYESAFAGMIMFVFFGVGGAVFGLVTLLKGMASSIYLGGFAVGFCSVVFILCLLRRCARPLLVLTADGFAAGSMKEEIPWAAVNDYWLAAAGGYGVQPSIDLTVELEEGYLPPESAGDRRATFTPQLRHLRISAVGIAGPYTLESLAEQFHTHWRGALARAALRQGGATL